MVNALCSRLSHIALALGLFAAASVACAGNDVVPGVLTSYATIENAGFEWRIEGDDNLNCSVTTAYRKQGDAQWKEAMPLFRVQPGIWNPNSQDPGNLLAGSIFFLEPGTTYEAKLSLKDPDGGADERTVTVTTRKEPQAAAGAPTYYMAPGSGGGSGTKEDPYKGLAANRAATPGDIFVLLPGTYAEQFAPSKDGLPGAPIVYRGQSVDAAVLDGNGDKSDNSERIVLTNRRYVFIENMTIRNSKTLIRADSSEGIVIRGCRLDLIVKIKSYGAMHFAESRNAFIADNFIQMIGDWAGDGRNTPYGTPGDAMRLEGTGHVVCYNTIYDAWDAVGFPCDDTQNHITSNCDVYNNDIRQAIDDGVQADFCRHNMRVYRNRIFNCSTGLSSQPSFGGPAYYLYNLVYNTRLFPYKYHQETYIPAQKTETSGFVAVNNTSYSVRSAWRPRGISHRAWHRNNILLGVEANVPSFDVGFVMHDASFDYNGYNRMGPVLVKFNGKDNANPADANYPTPVAYPDLPAFFQATGNEGHGIEVTAADFVKAVPPPLPDPSTKGGYGPVVKVADVDLQLSEKSAAIDKGIALPNISDGYLGNAPDLGCYEYGKPLPHYGTRIPGVLPAGTPK